MNGAVEEFPGLYALVITVPLYTLWCCSPNPCPASCAASSPVNCGSPPNCPENTYAVFGSPAVKYDPTDAVPPCTIPVQLPDPPITTRNRLKFCPAPVRFH